MSLSGTFVPMATPTTGRRGDVDTAALREFTRTLVDGGVHGLFPCGSIGEFSSLDADQRRRVVECVVDAADGTPVLAGCGDTSVAAVTDHIDAAAEAGADAAVVVTPYYLSTSQDGLRAFYRAVAAEAALPVVLYDIPALAGTSLSVETVVALADLDRIVGLKDTTGDLRYHHAVVTRTPDSFDVFQGATELAVASLDLGADGIVAGPANVAPAALAEVYDTHRAGDRDRAVELMNDVVLPLLEVTDDVPTAAALKYLLGLADCPVGDPLPPLPQLTDDEREALRERYDDLFGHDASRTP